MKKLAVLFTVLTASTALAQPGTETQSPEDCCKETEAQVVQEPARPIAAAPITAAPNTQPSGYAAPEQELTDEGWRRPPGQRFLHGIRIGWTYVFNFDVKNRTPDGSGDEMVSVKDKFELKTPNMMLLGYEGMYRVIGHSWLNVVFVGNVTVAGLEQSKFIPAASGLIGAEFNESFQLGVGVNVTPDPDAPTHAIFAAGWTPRVGSIHTPVHFFFVPEPSTNGQQGNHRMGATVGVTW